MVLELEFLVNFCIFMMFNHLPTHDKYFKSEAHDVKTRLFLSEHLKGSDWSWIFVKFLHFDVLQPFLYLSEKVQVCSSLYENWSILVRIFEGSDWSENPNFWSVFGVCSTSVYNTCDKIFQPEAHDMKIDLFLVDFERIRLIKETEFLDSFAFFWPATI